MPDFAVEPRRARTTRLPEWARWSTRALERPWTVGLEEEVMLLDPRRYVLRNRVEEVLTVQPRTLAHRTSAETHACVMELKTKPATTVREAVQELAGLRRSLAATLRERLDLRAATAGTHPFTTGAEVSASTGPRYREIEATMRALAHREPTMALHVHVAVPDGSVAVRAIDGLRHELPLLLALSANSPFWRGADSGFASIRTPIFSMFPRVGIPRRLGTYREYVRGVETLLRSRAIPEPGFLWFDARLQPRLGTIEVRVMDAQSRVRDVAALAAVVQALVRRCAGDGGQRPSTDADVLAENRFLAARDGMRATFVETPGRRRRAIDALADLLDACRATARDSGCGPELEAAAALADDPGYERQRRLARRRGLAAVPAYLADEFTASDAGEAGV